MDSRLSHFLPGWMQDYVDSIPKLMNYVLMIMALCNLLLLMAVFNATMLPNLGISPTFVSLLLIFQNGLAWIALNPQYASTTTLMTSDFLMGIVLGITVGGAILSFILSHFFGSMGNCIEIRMKNDNNYECQHQSQMAGIWFWSGIMFWLEVVLATLIVMGKDELLYNSHNYEHIGVALDDMENNFQRNSVYNPTSSLTTSNDGTFFGSAADVGSGHTTIGEATFPSTPSQEATSPSTIPTYGDSYHQSANARQDAHVINV